MRCSSIPNSLILVATAALSFGACAVDQAQPGGAGAKPPAAAAGAAAPATGAAGTGTSTSPVTGAAGGGAIAATAAGSAGAKAATGTAGTPAIASGGAAGASTAAASGAAGASTAAGGAAGASAGAAGGGAAAGGAVTFKMVHETVLTGAGCATPGCHGNAQGPSKLGFADPMDAYMGLVGVMAMGTGGPGSMTGGCMGMPVMRVKAGDPTMSLLVQKLENKQTCGQQMPPGGSISADKIQLVKDWIMAGAKND